MSKELCRRGGCHPSESSVWVHTGKLQGWGALPEHFRVCQGLVEILHQTVVRTLEKYLNNGDCDLCWLDLWFALQGAFGRHSDLSMIKFQRWILGRLSQLTFKATLRPDMVWVCIYQHGIVLTNGLFVGWRWYHYCAGFRDFVRIVVFFELYVYLLPDWQAVKREWTVGKCCSTSSYRQSWSILPMFGPVNEVS